MEKQTNKLNISVKSIIDIIFRNRLLIFITFLLCLIISITVIQFVTPIFDANVKMLVRGQNIISSETYVPIMGGDVHMTQAEIVKSYPVLKRAVIALGLQTRPLDYEKKYCTDLKKIYVNFKVKSIEKDLKDLTPKEREEMILDMAIGDLRDRLTVRLLPGTDIFIINVTAFTSEEAVETANIISRSYTIFDQIQQLAEVTMKYGEFHPTVIQLKDNITNATSNLSGKPLPDIEAIGTASVKIIEQARSDNLPVSKPIKVILIMALFISFSISFGLAILKGLFDSTIKIPQDMADYLDIPCIGSIPKKQLKDKYLITDESPDTRYFNFYEELAEQLFVFLKTQGFKIAVITSPLHDKNHKYIVPNIGYFLSKVMDKRVLLIDANFNKPCYHKIYSLDDENKIDINIPMDKIQDVVHKVPSGPDIVPAKKISEKPLTILRKINFTGFIETIQNKYDIILIDATSVNNIKDSSAISEYTDGTVLIIDEGKLKRKMLKNSLPRFMSNNAVIIAGVLNNRTFPVPDLIYKYFKYLLD